MMNLAGKNILVAGGTGLVGTNLTRRLHEMGASVRATYCSHPPAALSHLYEQRDFTEAEDCLEAAKGMDYMFLCAAQTFGAKVIHENPTIMIGPNLRIGAGLMEAARLHKLERVVYISSATVYPAAYYPIREDQLDLNEPVYPLYQGVGWMKRYMEQLASFYYARYGMKIGIVRPSNVYGPHDKLDDASAHVLPALIRRALDKQTPFVVWGDGSTIRDFVFVEDFTDALLNILEKYCVADPVNVGGGTPISVRQAVDVILKVCGHHVAPVYDITKPSAIPYRMLDTTKFNALFGQPRRSSFESGIQKTVAWYTQALAKAAV